MLACYVEWHMRDVLKPMLFHDEDPPEPVSAAARAVGRSRAQGGDQADRVRAVRPGLPGPDGSPCDPFQDAHEAEIGNIRGVRDDLDAAAAAGRGVPPPQPPDSLTPRRFLPSGVNLKVSDACRAALT